MTKKIVVVELMWDEDDLGPEWMNEGNLASLLYSSASTNKDLLAIVQYNREKGKKIVAMPKDIPIQYKPLWDRYIIQITDALGYLRPVLEELGGESITIEWDSYEIEIKPKPKSSVLLAPLTI